MHKKIKLVLKSLVSISLLIFLFSKIDLYVFWSTAKKANVPLVVIAALLFYSGLYFSILRWNSFLKFYKISVAKVYLFKLYWVGAFLNNFLPSSVGGDGYKLYVLSKKMPNHKKEILSSVVYERGTGFFVLLFLNFILFIIFFKKISSNNLTIFYVDCAVLALFFLFCIFRNNILAILHKLKLEIGIIKKISNLLKIFFALNDKKTLINALFYSFLFAFNAAIGAWILFLSLGVNVNIAYILFASTFAQILGILPVSINSIGISEGAAVYLYSIVGISPEISLAVALIARISMMFTSSISGLYLAKGEYKEKNSALM